jgi:hypothetical protein
LHDAATIVVAVELGCEFEDCRLTDDGYKWPTFVSSVEIKYPESWRGVEAFPAIATIHEAGCQAVAKRHGRGPHRINNYTAVRTSNLLDELRTWKAIETLARFIEDNYEGEGCYGALGTDASKTGDDSAALKLLKNVGNRRVFVALQLWLDRGLRPLAHNALASFVRCLRPSNTLRYLGAQAAETEPTS